MKETFKKWWDRQSVDNKIVFITTALITGCGFLFYRAGYKQGEGNMIKAILRYAEVPK